jgi:hypothetical protein
VRAIALILALLLLGVPQARAAGPPRPKSVLEMALRVADRMEDPFERYNVQEWSAIFYARIDPARSVGLAQRLISYSGEGTESLVSIAAALAPRDIERALQVLALADNARVSTIQDTFERTLESSPTAARRLFDAVVPLYTEIPSHFPSGEQRWLEWIPKVARRDPALAARIFDWAVARVRQATDPELKSTVLGTAVQVLLPREPERALALTQEMTYLPRRAEALLRVAAALHSRNPEQSRALYREGLDCWEHIPETERKGFWLEFLVPIWAEVEPDEAIALAQRDTDAEHRNMLLYMVYRELWKWDVERAVRLARSLKAAGGPARPEDALAQIAAGVAATDPDRALTIARGIPDGMERTSALQAAIGAIARRSLDRAAALLPLITDKEQRTYLPVSLLEKGGWDRASRVRLLTLAASAARQIPMPRDRVEWMTRAVRENWRTAPATAKRVLHEAYAVACGQSAIDDRDWSLGQVAEAAAEVDLDWGLQVAARIRDERSRGRAVADLCRALARRNPARAVRVATAVSSLPERGRALLEVAEGLLEPSNSAPRQTPFGNRVRRRRSALGPTAIPHVKLCMPSPVSCHLLREHSVLCSIDLHQAL